MRKENHKETNGRYLFFYWNIPFHSCSSLSVKVRIAKHRISLFSVSETEEIVWLSMGLHFTAVLFYSNSMKVHMIAWLVQGSYGEISGPVKDNEMFWALPNRSTMVSQNKLSHYKHCLLSYYHKHKCK